MSTEKHVKYQLQDDLPNIEDIFDLLSRETYTLQRSLPRLRVFLHDTNNNNVQTWYLFDINIPCKWFSNPVTYRDICNEPSAEDPFVFIYTGFPSFIIITL